MHAHNRARVALYLVQGSPTPTGTESKNRSASLYSKSEHHVSLRRVLMRNDHKAPVQQLWLLLTAGFFIQTLAGCQSPHYPSISQAGPLLPPRAALMPGDSIEVKFFYTPQLNEVQTIRPDGKISLQLVGEVQAQAKTPAELGGELAKLYTPYLRDPNVTVIVRTFFNRRVYVGGQVTKPGVVEMPAPLTVLEAIIQAGGFDVRDAELGNVIVIRHKDGQRYAYSLDLKPLLRGGEMQTFFLEPQDIVYVPQTEIARADQWVDQHINKIIPLTGFTFSRTVGHNTVGVDMVTRR